MVSGQVWKLPRIMARCTLGPPPGSHPALQLGISKPSSCSCAFKPSTFSSPLASSHPVPRPRTSETGQPLLLPHPHTWSVASAHPDSFPSTSLVCFLLVSPASVTLVQAFISFCWDQCSSLPKGHFRSPLCSEESYMSHIVYTPHFSGDALLNTS